MDRVSINPQSMEDRVLAAIGRRHSGDDIRAAMELVDAAVEGPLNAVLCRVHQLGGAARTQTEDAVELLHDIDVVPATAKKIEAKLTEMGINSHAVAMDNYFKTVDLETAPRARSA